MNTIVSFVDTDGKLYIDVKSVEDMMKDYEAEIECLKEEAKEATTDANQFLDEAVALVVENGGLRKQLDLAQGRADKWYREVLHLRQDLENELLKRVQNPDYKKLEDEIASLEVALGTANKEFNKVVKAYDEQVARSDEWYRKYTEALEDSADLQRGKDYWKGQYSMAIRELVARSNLLESTEAELREEVRLRKQIDADYQCVKEDYINEKTFYDNLKVICNDLHDECSKLQAERKNDPIMAAWISLFPKRGK